MQATLHYLRCVSLTLSSLLFFALSPASHADALEYQHLLSGAYPYILGATDSTASTTHVPADRPIVTQAYNDAVNVAFLLDKGSVYQYVVDGMLAKSGHSQQALFNTAKHNLWQRIEAGIKLYPVGNLKGIVMDGDFEASLFLIDHLWDNVFADASQGDIVAALPANDMMVFGYAENGAAIYELKMLVEKVWNDGGNNLITQALFIRKNGQWQTLTDTP